MDKTTSSYVPNQRFYMQIFMIMPKRIEMGRIRCTSVGRGRGGRREEGEEKGGATEGLDGKATAKKGWW